MRAPKFIYPKYTKHPNPKPMTFEMFYNGLSFDDTYKIIESWGKVPHAYMRGKKVTYGEADFQDLPKKLQKQIKGEAKEIMSNYTPNPQESQILYKAGARKK